MIKLVRKSLFGTNRSKRGFTLIEGIVTSLIFAIILGAVFAVLLTGSDSWQVGEVEVGVQQELRKAMDWVKEDLRQAGPSTSSMLDVDADDVWYTSITFKVAEGVSAGNIIWSTDTIRYELSGSDGDELHRIKGADDKIIAQNIQSLQFRRRPTDPNIVEVSLQAQRDTIKGRSADESIDFEIQLRN